MHSRGRIAGPLKDPLAGRLLAGCGVPRASARVRELAGVFGVDLLQSRRFLDRLDYWRSRLEQDAVAPVLQSVVADERA
jgi:hypothetical protein